MSSYLDSFLWQIARDIEPTAAQKAGAQRSHNYLRSLLDTGQMAGRISSSYLSGSYARDTAIKPLDDVDIIFELASNSYGMGGFLPLRPTPEQVLESFARAIRYRYPVSSVYGQRRSVRLELEHLDIDVVPAIVDSSDSSLIFVPDRETAQWIKSSPKNHSANATRVNAKHAGRFKPLVKLLKYWNSNLPDTIRAKSFMVETMAVRIFDSVALPELEKGLLYFFDFVATRYGDQGEFAWKSDYGMSFDFFGVRIPDAAGTGSNTAGSFDSSRGRALAAKARISRDRMKSAASARSSESAASWVMDALRA
jgi:hypothetical protein